MNNNKTPYANTTVLTHDVPDIIGNPGKIESSAHPYNNPPIIKNYLLAFNILERLAGST